MPQVMAYIDQPTYHTIKRLMAELEAFKEKWPNDYKSRSGYQSLVERILEHLPYAFGR